MFKLWERNVQLYKPSIQDMVILGNLCVRHKKKQRHQCNLLMRKNIYGNLWSIHGNLCLT